MKTLIDGKDQDGTVPLEIVLAFQAAFGIEKFEPVGQYKEGIVHMIRFIQNMLAHLYQIFVNAMLSASNYSPESFVKCMIKKVPFFAVDVQRLIYILHHDDPCSALRKASREI